MKSFIISLCAVMLLVGMVIINGIFVGNVTNELLDEAENLTPESEEEFSSLYEYWKKNEGIICFSVSHKDVDNVNIALSVLKEKYENGDMAGFYEYKSLLSSYIEEIKNKERVHIHNIL